MSLQTVHDKEPHPRGISVFCAACATGLLAAFLFSAFPEIDLWASRFFYGEDGTFAFSRPSLGADIRDLLRLIFAVVCMAAVVGFISLGFFGRKLGGVGLAAWAYIALCAAIGPGLVANLGFKDHWGRARPSQIEEFGGTKAFTPPLQRTDQCESNCSFISGEASNYFMIGFALVYLATGVMRRRLFLIAIAAGSFAGLIRIGGGGHFLSDVVFSGVFMALVCTGLARLMLERESAREFFADGSPFHESMLRAGGRMADALSYLVRSFRKR
ncbi:MAG TPA: phosphatase PAP2 family protein [Hyphomicrobiales bacterium]|nr:phosphatase PAP2 family protein [Hyphomicrobiales bacterium]